MLPPQPAAAAAAAAARFTQHHKYSHNQQHGQTQQNQTLRYTDGHDGDGDGSGIGMLGVDPAFAARVEAEIVQSCPNVGFDDIAGLTFAKQTIRELIVYPLQRPDLCIHNCIKYS